MDDLIQKAKDLLTDVPGGAMTVAASAAVLVVMLVVWRVLRKRKPPLAAPPVDLRIDVGSLGEQGPPPGPPAIEFYNIPVRLAAVVLAPVGRSRGLPPPGETARLLEAILPGLSRVAQVHRPLVRSWPNQFSARGFAHVLFANVRLPGDGGKGTPWSSVAGMFKLDGQPVMAGLVLRAAQPNSLGQIIVESEHEWLGCLRVREGA
jgi:hypothetical protein